MLDGEILVLTMIEAQTKTVPIDNRRHSRLKKAAQKFGVPIKHLHGMLFDYAIAKLDNGEIQIGEPEVREVAR